MGTNDESRLDLMRQLKVAAQLQHACLTQVWQVERGMPPAAVFLLSDLQKNGEARPSELAKRRMVDLSVISRQITQLTEAGYLERRPAPEDGRASLVRASDKGVEELDRWRTYYLDFIERALGDWDDERVARLTGLLGEMNDDLREALGPQAACAPAPLMANFGK